MTIDAVGMIPSWTLADRLRKSRELTGLDGQDFAAEVGLSRNAVTNAERGHAVPRELTLRAWALRTGVNLEWLKTGKAPQDAPGGPMLPEMDSNHQPAGYLPVVSLLARRLAA